LQRADTVGLFQVESRAQMSALPRNSPRCFYDIVIQVAIIRPGPIVGKMMNPFLKRRQNLEPVQYAHPSLEPVLKRTLGVPLFQEQLLRMAMVVANFSGGEAEELRRAMGNKRSQAKMAAIEARLRSGMTKNGISRKAQDEIVQSIVSFALYGFPESHAASFALLAYASAYLKCNYLAAFTAALLNNQPMGFYHPATIVKDAQRHGLKVRPVDVTRSQWPCTLECECGEDAPHNRAGCKLSLRMGLRYVRGLREEAAQSLVRERTRTGFASVDDLARRVRELRRNELNMLAQIGALNGIGGFFSDATDEQKCKKCHPEPLLAKDLPEIFTVPCNIAAFPLEPSPESRLRAKKSDTCAGDPPPKAAQDDSPLDANNGTAEAVPLPKSRSVVEASQEDSSCEFWVGSPDFQSGESAVADFQALRQRSIAKNALQRRPAELPGAKAHFQTDIALPLDWKSSSPRLEVGGSHLEGSHIKDQSNFSISTSEAVSLPNSRCAPMLHAGDGACPVSTNGNGKLHRRDALWQVERAAWVEGPLLAEIAEADSPSPLARMNLEERLIADYHGTGLTVGPHPMLYRRDQMNRMKVVRAIDLHRLKHGQFTRIAGCVIARQRPGTANGFIFLSLEDETGISNAIITPDLYDQNRLLVIHERFLLIEGILQNVENVISVKAVRVSRLEITEAATRSHDFH
jgi:DNA polymerase III alpha subunit